MNVVNATLEDLNRWLELAAEVECLFGPMVDDPNFVLALERNIHQNRAFCVREFDGSPGCSLLGGLLLSTSNAPSYKIGWLSVSAKARNKGVASALLNHVLTLVDVPSEIAVTTFGDDVLDGMPARRLYEKFGFIPLEESIPNGPEGGSRQKFQLTIAHR